jgi:hypothetical protein
MFGADLLGILGTDPAAMGDAELGDHVEALCALADRLEAARLLAVGEWDARAVWALDGAPNGGTWLAARGRLGRAQAGGIVRTARRLRSMPATADAVRAGRLGTAKARLLAGAINDRTEEAFAADEDTLVAEASALTVDQTATMVRFWAMRVDADGASADAMSEHRADSAHISQTLGGRWQLDASFDTECGSIFHSVLSGIADELYRATKDAGGPMRSATELRAEALVEMARRATAAGERPSSRPLVWVMVDLDDLRRRAGAAEVVGAGPITAEAARRLACDADVARVLMDGPSVIVDVGHASRTATPVQRRVLALRDRGCVFPGCDRPPGWCQAHHIIHWEDDGPTDLDNLCLMCSFHHHLVHEGGYGLKRAGDGTLMFTDPDGSLVRAPTVAA